MTPDVADSGAPSAPAVLTPEQKQNQAIFNDCVNALDNDNTKQLDRKKLADVRKRLGKLYSTYDQLPADCNKVLTNIATAVQGRNWKAALAEHSVLASQFWSGPNSFWIPGIKTLLLTAHKYNL
jgi:hypothetical protein